MNYCITCKRSFHYLGIARHRAMHRDKKQYCEIIDSKGKTYAYHYNRQETKSAPVEDDK